MLLHRPDILLLQDVEPLQGLAAAEDVREERPKMTLSSLVLALQCQLLSGRIFKRRVLFEIEAAGADKERHLFVRCAEGQQLP